MSTKKELLSKHDCPTALMIFFAIFSCLTLVFFIQEMILIKNDLLCMSSVYLFFTAIIVLTCLFLLAVIITFLLIRLRKQNIELVNKDLLN